MSGPARALATRDSLTALQRAMARFVTARDWQTYHKPKDLAVALSVEAGELLENFLWRSADGEYLKDNEWREGLAEEMAARSAVIGQSIDWP